MKSTARKWIADVCAFSLVFLFVYTATSKLFRYDLFRFQLDGYPWIKHFAFVLAWAVPAIELVAAGLLLLARTKRIGLYLSLALMLLFTGYLALMLASGRPLPCSCGGVIGWMTWKQHLVFNLFFMGAAAAGLVFSSPPKIPFYANEHSELIQT